MVDLFHRRRLFVLSFFAVFALVLGVAAVVFADECVYAYGAVQALRGDIPRGQPSRLAPWPESVMGVLRYLIQGGSLDKIGRYQHFGGIAWAAVVGLVGLLAPAVSRGRGRAIAISASALLLVQLVLHNFWIPMTGYEGPGGLASLLDLGCMIVVAYAVYCLYIARDEFRRCAELPAHG